LRWWVRGSSAMIAVGGAPGADCAGCGEAQNGVGPMNYVGHGQGGYILDTGYKYVGFGGDHGRPRRDFTCIICLSSLLLLIPLLLWLLMWGRNDWCDTGYERCQMVWGMRQQDDCCSRRGMCCARPPVQGLVVSPQAPVGPVGPVDPFNCADDFAEWKAGWSVSKKQWCCNIHGRGCPENGEGYEPAPASQYDCNSGFANWVKGWSVPKKTWCCQYAHKGCVGTGDMTMGQAAGQGYGAGAQHGTTGAPVAAITGIIPHGAGR